MAISEVSETKIQSSNANDADNEESSTFTVPSLCEEHVEKGEQMHEPNGMKESCAKGTNEVDNRKRKTPIEEGGEKINALPPLWKTSLCSFFRRQSASCTHGDSCRYAHGEEELRPRPDDTWDPTSQKAKKLLKANGGDKVEVVYARQDILVPDVCVDSVDFSTEKCLVHLPRKWVSEDLKTFLHEKDISFKTAKKKKGMVVGFVGFSSTEEVRRATEELSRASIGNKQIKVADVLPRTFEKKPKSVLEEKPLTNNIENEEIMKDREGIDGKNTEAIDGEKMSRCVRDVVTPLAKFPYSEQLEQKKTSLSQLLKRLTRNARKACPNELSLPEWILNSRENGGLPCKFEGIIESPLINGYRNKCEFSVGYSVQGKRTVGFTLGNFREGITAIEEPFDCPNVSSISCKFVSIFQDFLQTSTLPVWNRIKNTGFWHQFTVREGRRSPSENTETEHLNSSIAEVMLIVQVCTPGVDNETLTSEFQKMAQALADGAFKCSPPLPLTALVVQDHKGISNVAPADAPLFSLSIQTVGSNSSNQGQNLPEERMHDYLCNLQFCISPTAFFQVNTLAAEKLYSLAGDWACLDPDTLLFDICCGTGTIGLTLANRVGMVIGVEMNASAISDAERNAEINGIKNCKFVCSKAENVIDSLLREYLNASSHQEESSDFPGSNDKLNSSDEANAATMEINGLNSDQVITSDPSDVTNSPILEVPMEPKPNAADKLSHNGGLIDLKDMQPKHCNSEKKDKIEGNIGKFKSVVVIVDPPRVGLHPVVIKTLRTHPSLRRLVYISCNPESLVANAIELCTPTREKAVKIKNNKGWRNMSSAGLARHRTKSMPNSEPFIPIKAMAVDLFPHTPHCETVMLFER